MKKVWITGLLAWPLLMNSAFASEEISFVFTRASAIGKHENVSEAVGRLSNWDNFCADQNSVKESLKTLEDRLHAVVIGKVSIPSKQRWTLRMDVKCKIHYVIPARNDARVVDGHSPQKRAASAPAQEIVLSADGSVGAAR